MTIHNKDKDQPKANWIQDKGRDLLILENNCLRITAWPAFGGAVLGIVDCESGIDVMWHNPLLEPSGTCLSAQPVEGNSDLYDFLDGSWFLSLPTGFFPTSYFGAPIGAHGEIRSVCWEVVEITETDSRLDVRLVGNSVRTPFRVERTWTLLSGSRSLIWKERIINRSTRERPVSWLHHPAFGGPIVDGAELRVACREVGVYAGFDPEQVQVQPGYRGAWPWVPETPLGGGQQRDCSRVPPAGSGKDHSIMLTGFDIGWGCLWNSKLQLGFGLRWDETVFPWAWSWMNAGGPEDYPLWGRGHLATLQPGTSPVAPFPELVESGQVLTIPAGDFKETTFVSGFLSDPEVPLNLPEG